MSKNSERVIKCVKNNYRPYTLKIKKEDKTILEYFNSIQNKNEYLLKLIEEDMNKKK